MLKFKKLLILKIIALVVVATFSVTSTLYSYTISKDSLRVPAGQTGTYNRITEVIRTWIEQQKRIDPNIASAHKEGRTQLLHKVRPDVINKVHQFLEANGLKEAITLFENLQNQAQVEGWDKGGLWLVTPKKGEELPLEHASDRGIHITDFKGADIERAYSHAIATYIGLPHWMAEPFEEAYVRWDQSDTKEPTLSEDLKRNFLEMLEERKKDPLLLTHLSEREKKEGIYQRDYTLPDEDKGPSITRTRELSTDEISKIMGQEGYAQLRKIWQEFAELLGMDVGEIDEEKLESDRNKYLTMLRHSKLSSIAVILFLPIALYTLLISVGIFNPIPSLSLPLFFMQMCSLPTSPYFFLSNFYLLPKYKGKIKPKGIYQRDYTLAVEVKSRTDELAKGTLDEEAVEYFGEKGITFVNNTYTKVKDRQFEPKQVDSLADHPFLSVTIDGLSDERVTQFRRLLMEVAPSIPVHHAKLLHRIDFSGTEIMGHAGGVRRGKDKTFDTITIAKETFDSYEMVVEIVIHELGHLVTLNMVLPDSTQQIWPHLGSSPDKRDLVQITLALGIPYSTYVSFGYFMIGMIGEANWWSTLTQMGVLVGVVVPVSLFFAFVTMHFFDWGIGLLYSGVTQGWGSFVSLYAMRRDMEDFAETYQHYVRNREKFYRQAQRNKKLYVKYKAIQELFEGVLPPDKSTTESHETGAARPDNEGRDQGVGSSPTGTPTPQTDGVSPLQASDFGPSSVGAAQVPFGVELPRLRKRTIQGNRKFTDTTPSAADITTKSRELFTEIQFQDTEFQVNQVDSSALDEVDFDINIPIFIAQDIFNNPAGFIESWEKFARPDINILAQNKEERKQVSKLKSIGLIPQGAEVILAGELSNRLEGGQGILFGFQNSIPTNLPDSIQKLQFSEPQEGEVLNWQRPFMLLLYRLGIRVEYDRLPQERPFRESYLGSLMAGEPIYTDIPIGVKVSEEIQRAYQNFRASVGGV